MEPHKQVIDERLPGRTADEERTLRDVVKDVETALRRRGVELGKPIPPTDRGMSGRMDRMNTHEGALDNAMAALRARLDQLVAERMQLLPDDATEVRHGVGGGGDLWDDRRYPVICTSESRGQVSLGGCSTLGPAQDRVRWFADALAERLRTR